MRRFLRSAALVCAVLGTGMAAQAKDAADVAADPALEKRMLAVASELRCLVCQNETIAASSADLAVDLRNQVREMLRNGQSEKEIVDYMTARYGDFVLYRPPVRTDTALLWFGPAALMVAGLTILVVVLRRRSRLPADHFEPDEADVTDTDANAPDAGRPGKSAP